MRPQGAAPSPVPSEGILAVTHGELVALKEAGNLSPGKFYRITDYVATVGLAYPDTRSAGHPFDVIVRADSPTVLNEQAWAALHEGDEYFAGANLAAWQLRYTPDNVGAGALGGTYATEMDNGYLFHLEGPVVLGGATYQLWKGFGEYTEDYGPYALTSEEEPNLLKAWDGTVEDFNYEWLGTVGVIISRQEETPGKGTILWMRDEWGNEAAHDFKGILQKRYQADYEISGETNPVGYCGVMGNPDPKMSVYAGEQFPVLWSYLFGTCEDGDTETTDLSLSGNVFDMKTNFAAEDNNVFLDVKSGGGPKSRAASPDAVFFRCTFTGYTHDNTFMTGTTDSRFEGGCFFNTFYLGVRSSTFGEVSCFFYGAVDSSEIKNCESSFFEDISSCRLDSIYECGIHNHISGCSLGDMSMTEVSYRSGYILRNLYTFGSLAGQLVRVPEMKPPIFMAPDQPDGVRIWNPISTAPENMEGRQATK